MTHHFYLTAVLAVAALFSPVSAQTKQEAPTKESLEVIYNTWRQAMIRGDYEVWKKNTSAYRQMKVRNLAVSEKRDFPSSIFRQQLTPPSLTGLKYVGTILKGPTAASTYYGKIDWNIGGNPSNNALVLLFTHENGAWKYDQSRFFNLGHLPETRERLSERDSKVLLEQDGFQPLGYVPPVPKACPAPQYIAKVYIDCPGRNVDVTVNGISSHTFENTNLSEVISGGVKDGTNTITVKASTIADAKTKGPMIIEVFIMPEIVGDLPGRAFTLTIQGDNQNPINQTYPFTVNSDVLKKMRPSQSEKETKANS